MAIFNERIKSAALIATLIGCLTPLERKVTAADLTTPCLFNEKQEICEISLDGDDIELRLDENRRVEISRRGRCTNRVELDVTIRSCNVRIGLPNDFVYGLIKRRGVSAGGTVITSPQLEIKLPEIGL